MEHPENRQKNLLSALFRTFPRPHAAAAAGLATLLIAVNLLPSPPAEAQKEREFGTLPLPPSTALAPDSEPLTDIYHDPQIPPHTVIDLSVKSGDSLAILFKRAGLSDRDLMNFMGAADEAKKLSSLKPGNTLRFELDQDRKIVSLKHLKDVLTSDQYSINENGRYSFEEQKRLPDVQRATRSGEIQSSLYAAGIAAGLDDKLIMELAEIFGWDVDFALDIRSGDQFRILYEERFLDGDKLDNGAILSAEFINQGQSFKAVRYIHDDGRVEYYTPDGRNMRKAFLRAPVDFRRISSSFNPRRLHPVTGVVRPHRGIDYAASVGTPVWSPGDGKVLVSGYSKANGNYVVIQHGNNVQTKYLHLSKRNVKSGQRVKQKQIIGAVGATGLVTGPHLHYEFLLNGVHRNPRTILNSLPKAESIAPSIKSDFLLQTQPLIAELRGETDTRYASSGEEPDLTAL